MEINLSQSIRKALGDSLKKAHAAEKADENLKAAALFESASKLQLKLASYEPLRNREIEMKKEAVDLWKYAGELRKGPIKTKPGPRDTAKTTDSEKQGEIRNAVTALITTSPITWDQIGGLEATKREIKYTLALTVALPPEDVKINTWRNILFYGPPGTGKTLLAAATSNALRTADDRSAVFFNVKVSSVMSKYFGESTKIISELYGTARDLSPAIIFLDEFESLAASRDGATDTGPERRILSTILSEMDGLAEKGKSGVFVLTIAATNRPWDIDAAVLSRFEKKILIPMPDAESRRKILEILLTKKGYDLDGITLEGLSEMTDGFSGREIERFTKETTARMVAEMNEPLLGLVDEGLDSVKDYRVRVRPLARADFEWAAGRTTPGISEAGMRRYLDWKAENA